MLGLDTRERLKPESLAEAKATLKPTRAEAELRGVYVRERDVAEPSWAVEVTVPKGFVEETPL
jgi:hypothetical protein